MKKKTVMCFMAALCLGSSMTAYAAPGAPAGVDPIEFADFDGYHIEDENGNWHYVPKEVTCNGMISLNTDDPVYPVYNPVYIDFTTYTAVEMSTLSDEQLLHYLFTEERLDVDALTWWVGTDYDNDVKFALLASAQSTATASSMWIIQSDIPWELKEQYFRTHDIGHNSEEVLQWWFDNVGKKLATEETTRTDAKNYGAFRGMTLLDTNTTECVEIGDTLYTIAKEDLAKALEEGKIKHRQTKGTFMGEPFIDDHYYTSSTDIGYKMWGWL